MKHLTNREEEIMEMFWAKGALFVKDIIEALDENPKPHYNTISTIVRGLEEKGFVGHKQYGNTYLYHAEITREAFSKNSVRKLVSKYFDKSYASLVSMFVEEEDLSPEEIKELIRLAESHKNNKDE